MALSIFVAFFVGIVSIMLSVFVMLLNGSIFTILYGYYAEGRLIRD